MDFQWQQGHGPASADSPFLKNTNHHEQLNGFAGQKSVSSLLQSNQSIALWLIQDFSRTL